MEQKDISLIVAEIKKLGSIQPSIDPCWTRPSALKVIDCVLSLNRNYDKFVVPRLEKFASLHPSVRKIQDLRALMDSFPSPAGFVESELNYKDAARAQVLSGVIDYISNEIKRIGMEAEEDALIRWAQEARPQDYLVVRVRGFGLAGFQYLRMLFGANTTKPDVHICRFVGQALNRSVDELTALDNLEQAAEQAGIMLRDLDTTIWERSARGIGQD
jgi:hypothetical protein